jgi:hypothetical protein
VKHKKQRFKNTSPAKQFDTMDAALTPLEEFVYAYEMQGQGM